MDLAMQSHFSPILKWLSSAYIALLIFSSIEPYSRAVWIAEVIPAIVIFSGIWLMSNYHRFSPTAYFLMFIWLALHTIGAKYTFALVPFDCFNEFFDSSRNHFDRVAHYSIGLYAYPIAEYLISHKKMPYGFSVAFALFSIMSLAAGYEIIEWWYAALAGGDEGIAFLGSQGDVWDAQKDMLMDTLGAISSLILLTLQQRVFASNQAK